MASGRVFNPPPAPELTLEQLRWLSQCLPIFVQPDMDIRNGHPLVKVFAKFDTEADTGDYCCYLYVVFEGEGSYQRSRPTSMNRLATFLYRTHNRRAYGRTADIDYLIFKGVDLTYATPAAQHAARALLRATGGDALMSSSSTISAPSNVGSCDGHIAATAPSLLATPGGASNTSKPDGVGNPSASERGGGGATSSSSSASDGAGGATESSSMATTPPPSGDVRQRHDPVTTPLGGPTIAASSSSSEGLVSSSSVGRQFLSPLSGMGGLASVSPTSTTAGGSSPPHDPDAGGVSSTGPTLNPFSSPSPSPSPSANAEHKAHGASLARAGDSDVARSSTDGAMEATQGVLGASSPVARVDATGGALGGPSPPGAAGVPRPSAAVGGSDDTKGRDEGLDAASNVCVQVEASKGAGDAFVSAAVTNAAANSIAAASTGASAVAGDGTDMVTRASVVSVCSGTVTPCSCTVTPAGETPAGASSQIACAPLDAIMAMAIAGDVEAPRDLATGERNAGAMDGAVASAAEGEARVLLTSPQVQSMASGGVMAVPDDVSGAWGVGLEHVQSGVLGIRHANAFVSNVPVSPAKGMGAAQAPLDVETGNGTKTTSERVTPVGVGRSDATVTARAARDAVTVTTSAGYQATVMLSADGIVGTVTASGAMTNNGFVSGELGSLEPRGELGASGGGQLKVQEQAAPSTAGAGQQAVDGSGPLTAHGSMPREEVPSPSIHERAKDEGRLVGGPAPTLARVPWRDLFSRDHAGDQTWSQGDRGNLGPWVSFTKHYKKTVPYASWQRDGHRPRVYLNTSNHLMGERDNNPGIMPKFEWREYAVESGDFQRARWFARTQVKAKANLYSWMLFCVSPSMWRGGDRALRAQRAGAEYPLQLLWEQQQQQQHEQQQHPEQHAASQGQGEPREPEDAPEEGVEYEDLDQAHEVAQTKEGSTNAQGAVHVALVQGAAEVGEQPPLAAESAN